MVLRFLCSQRALICGSFLLLMMGCEVLTPQSSSGTARPNENTSSEITDRVVATESKINSNVTVDKSHEGPPEIEKLWSSFMVHPKKQVAPDFTRDWFEEKCLKVHLSSADDQMGLPIYVGWEVHSENPLTHNVKVYVDSLSLDEAPELQSSSYLSNGSIQSFIDRPMPDTPALTVTQDGRCMYFYNNAAAYRIHIQVEDQDGNLTEFSSPIVASIFQKVTPQDLTSYLSMDLSVSRTQPELPDQMAKPWVEFLLADPVSYDFQDETLIEMLTTEFHKTLKGLEYLIHLFVDDRGVSQKLSIPHLNDVGVLAYKEVQPFEYFSFIYGSPSGSPSHRHELMTYRYNDACNFSLSNARVEACRRGDLIVLYAQFFDHLDDFRRAVILLHEASHKPIEEGGVGPHSFGKGGDTGPGSYTTGLSIIVKLLENSTNCFEKSSAYAQMVNICSLNIVTSKEFYDRHCSSGECDSEWVTLLEELGGVGIDSVVNPNGECFPGRNDIPTPGLCDVSIESLLQQSSVEMGN
jgi:hypothetical protein